MRNTMRLSRGPKRMGRPVFVIDKEHGERPVCVECRKPFRATRKQIQAFRGSHPRIAVVCPDCIIRECGKAETLHREAALAI